MVESINDDHLWEEFNRWLEKQGHDEAPGWLTATHEFLGWADGEEIWMEV